MLGAGFVILALVLYGSLFRGVRVKLDNQGQTVMKDCIVHVTGKSYALGDLSPGQSRLVKVRPRGESHVELEYTDPAGSKKRLVADCYFEGSHYHGRISISVKDGVIQQVSNDIRIGL